jgi:hypothetical protein
MPMGVARLFARESAGMSSQPRMKAHRAHHPADVEDANWESRALPILTQMVGHFIRASNIAVSCEDRTP